MYKISEIISKPVFSAYEGSYLGTISNFIFNKNQKKIIGLCILNDDLDYSVGFIPTKNIFSLNESLIVKNIDSVMPLPMDEQKIMNQKAISIFGEDLGLIIDVFFDEKYNILSFETSKQIILPINSLIKSGTDINLFNTSDKKINISKMKPVNKIDVNNLPDIKVSILSDTIPIISSNFNQDSFILSNKIEGEKQLKSRTEIEFPKKIGISNPLIGKKVNNTIIGLNGEVIIKDRQIITQSIYDKAKKHGKIFELEDSVE